MSKHDYVPRNDNKLLDWAKVLLDYAGMMVNCQRWGVIPPPDTLTDAFAGFEKKLKKCKSPSRSLVDVAAKNVVKVKLVKELRNYIQGFLARNTNVTKEDRVMMSLPVYDTTPTNVAPPTMQAEGTLAFRGIGLVEIRDIRPATEKPEAKTGYGVRIYYGIKGVASATNRFRISERPRMGDEMPHSVFTRKKRYLFDFTRESGNEVFFCLRYENPKGQTVPWGQSYRRSCRRPVFQT